MIGALEVVDQLRNEPIRDPSSEALHISRRPLRPVPRSSSLPISRDRSHKTASINVFKIPKKRRLKTDFKHVKERLERKHHHLTSSEKMHRRRVRMIWERRNASALKRRERFLQSRNGHR
jgi:hypothetical protein